MSNFSFSFFFRFPIRTGRDQLIGQSSAKAASQALETCRPTTPLSHVRHTTQSPSDSPSTPPVTPPVTQSRSSSLSKTLSSTSRPGSSASSPRYSSPPPASQPTLTSASHQEHPAVVTNEMLQSKFTVITDELSRQFSTNCSETD